MEEALKDAFNPLQAAANLAKSIEEELRRLHRWSLAPLTDAQFENMGAFGENTMRFEQWIQFVLLVRLREIAEETNAFPEDSMLGAYVARNYDWDEEATRLHELLQQVDELVDRVNSKEEEIISPPTKGNVFQPRLGAKIPEVVFSLLEVLPQFEGPDLEAQLQTYDVFLAMLDDEAKQEIVKRLLGAAEKTNHPLSKTRIIEAAHSILAGNKATEPYNHAAFMKKYKEDHQKNFPENPSGQ